MFNPVFHVISYQFKTNLIRRSENFVCGSSITESLKRKNIFIERGWEKSFVIRCIDYVYRISLTRFVWKGFSVFLFLSRREFANYVMSVLWIYWKSINSMQNDIIYKHHRRCSYLVQILLQTFNDWLEKQKRFFFSLFSRDCVSWFRRLTKLSVAQPFN